MIHIRGWEAAGQPPRRFSVLVLTVLHDWGILDFGRVDIIPSCHGSTKGSAVAVSFDGVWGVTELLSVADAVRISTRQFLRNGFSLRIYGCLCLARGRDARDVCLPASARPLVGGGVAASARFLCALVGERCRRTLGICAADGQHREKHSKS